MGQLDSKEVERMVIKLEATRSIHHAQAQKFMQDYETNESMINDVKTYRENKDITTFLKHFIKSTYPNQIKLTNNSQESIKGNDAATLLKTLNCTFKEKHTLAQNNFSTVIDAINRCMIDRSLDHLKDYFVAILRSFFGIKDYMYYKLERDTQDNEQTTSTEPKHKIYQYYSQSNLFTELYPEYEGCLYEQVFKYIDTIAANTVEVQTSPELIGLTSEDVWLAIKCSELKGKKQQTMNGMQGSMLEENINVNNIKPMAKTANEIEGPYGFVFFIKLGSTTPTKVPERSTKSIQIPAQTFGFKFNHYQQDLIFQVGRKCIQLSTFECSNHRNPTIIAQICKNLIQLFLLSIKYDISDIKAILMKIDSKAMGLNDTSDSKVPVNPKTKLKALVEEIVRKKFDVEAVKHHYRPLLQEIERYEEKVKGYRKKVKEYTSWLNSRSLIIMEFDKYSYLRFISNNHPKHEIMSIMAANKKSCQFKVADIFPHSYGLLQNIKKASKGLLGQGVHHETDDDMRASIYISPNGVLERIEISIEQDIDNSLRTINLLKEQCERSYSDDEEFETCQNSWNQYYIDKIEQEYPGISKEGWLELYLNKNYSLPKKKRNKVSIDNGSKLTSGKFEAFEINDVIVENFHEINLTNVDINLLQLSEAQLKCFAVRNMRELAFFQDLSPSSKKKFNCFLNQLLDAYETYKNPFHNIWHAVNVMHTCYLIGSLPKNDDILSDLLLFTLVFSGLCHDTGHRGYTNAFEIASRSDLAITYNDTSPLQNHHVSLSFKILKKESNNFLSGLRRNQYLQFRRNFISNILYTDIKEHFPLLKKFQAKKDNFNKNSHEDITILMGIIIHTSDFGGSAKSFEVSREWARRVNTEFSNQYKREGELGLPQTPYMFNLKNEAVLSKNESGFLKIIVLPLFQVMNQFYKENRMKSFLNYVEKNIGEWQAIHKSSVDKEKEKEIEAEEQK